MGLNIRQKIFLSFILVVLISAGAVFTIYTNSVRVTDLSAEITHQNVRSIVLAQTMLQQLLMSDWAVSQFQLTGDPSWINMSYKAQQVFKDSWREVKILATDERKRELVAKVKTLNQRYVQQTHSVIERIQQGLINPQHQQYFRDETSVLQAIIDCLQTLITLNEGQLYSRLEEAQRLKNWNQGLSVGVVLLVTLVSALLVFILNQNIISPIARLMDGVRKFANGNFTAQVPVMSSDEIGELSGAFNIMAKNIKNDRQKLTALTITDEKTGLFNYRYFKQTMTEEMKRAERYSRHLSLVIMDIDFFKHYNDTNGHNMGDLLLKELAALLKESVRETDLVARFGGEEFVLLLPETPVSLAFKLADNIRLRIKNHAFPMEEKQPNHDLTMSMGVASFPAKNILTPDALIEKADQNLYRAKKSGRNRVCR
ncbi:MAG: diguanylate cyclase [Candidatus Firestonebacteria bacterium]|nr:diguanylate cyclase [Candidatus Firestonebacteria bacterium]